MSNLIKFAVAAAIVGAAVAVLFQRGSRKLRDPGRSFAPGLGRAADRSWVSPLEEVTDEHAVWGGGGSGLN